MNFIVVGLFVDKMVEVYGTFLDVICFICR